MTQFHPVAPKKKSSLLTIALGCLGVVVILVVVAVLGSVFWFKNSEFGKTFSKNPAQAAAMLIIKSNPDLEVVKTDDADGTITVRNRKTKEETTMSFNDIQKGKFSITDANGQQTTFDGTGGKDGKVTITGKDGQTVIGTEATPPKWAPTYPGLKSLSGVRTTKDGKVSGSYTSETSDAPAKVQEFFHRELTNGGFQLDEQTLNQNGQNAATITGTHADHGQKVSVMISGEGGKTALVVNYEEKP